MRPPRSVYVATVVLLAACSGGPSGTTEGASAGSSTGGEVTSESSTSESSTSETSDGTSGGLVCPYPERRMVAPSSPDRAPECACVSELGALECASSICPVMTGTCVLHEYSLCIGWEYDEAALTCALEALRDGKEGTLSWYYSPNGGYSEVAGYLHILPGRQVIRQDRSREDLNSEVGDTALWALKDAEHFEACLALAGVCERSLCLFAGILSPAISLCAPGMETGY